MELNGRCVQLLREVVLAGGSAGQAELLSRPDMTKRTLYYDLSKINDWLGFYKLGSLRSGGRSLTLCDSDPQRVLEMLGVGAAHQYSAEERRALELLFIALDAAPVTIERMQRMFDVSKNTVLSDIREWKKQLAPLPAQIESSAKGGYSLVGEEVSIRKLLTKQIVRLDNDYPHSVLRGVIQASLASLAGHEPGSEPDFWQLVSSGVRDYERSINTYLILSDKNHEVMMILVACIRSLKGCPYTLDTQEKDTLKNTSEYSTVLLIVQKLYDAKINLLLDEAYYITILFLGIKNFDFSSSAAENSYIQQFSWDLVHNFARLACVRFENKTEFLNRLCQHIRPMYYRMKYGIRASNPLLGQIQSMYGSVYEYTKRALEAAGGEIASLITEEEISYLCIYMASYLGENHPPQRGGGFKVLIICGAGVAASVLLREQMTELLGDGFQYHLTPAPMLASENLWDYSIIVSTVPLEGDYGNVIMTGPILSGDAKDEIVTLIARECYTSASREAAEILAAVRKSAAVSDDRRLHLDLLRYCIRRESRGVSKMTPRLADLLRRGGCVGISAAATPEAAFTQLAGLITSNADLRGLCAGQMMRHINEYGLCGISEGVALEYCQTGEVTAAILLFPQSTLELAGRSVSILIALSTVDNYAHQTLLNDIYRYFDRPGICHDILSRAEDGRRAERILLERMP